MFNTDDLYFGSELSACFDLKSDAYYYLPKNVPTLVGTGLKLTDDFPRNSYVQILSRSGLSTKGVFVLNSPGIVDADYRDEVKVVLMWNGFSEDLDQKYFQIKPLDRVAQAMVLSLDPAQETLRRNNSFRKRHGGFGSTG